MCDSRMFRGQLDTFANSLCIDGYYGSCSRLEDMAAYALERMPGKFILFGHSMGARVALEILRRVPSRVERLVLADTGTHPVRPDELEKRNALRDFARAQGMAAMVDQWLPPMLGESAKQNENLTAELRAMCIAAGVGCYERQIEALLNRPKVDTLLGGIRCPTLVLVGREDKWSSVEQHRDIAAAIPGSRLEVIDGAGHMMPAEQPGRLNAILHSWLS